jgi:hypothetical protein
MAEYCNKMIEYISKITERYIKMAYSKHKMTEYRSDGGLDVSKAGQNYKVKKKCSCHASNFV